MDLSINVKTPGVSLQTFPDLVKGTFRWVLEVDPLEFGPGVLDERTLRLTQECLQSESVADKLLALETIVRNIEIKNGVPQP